MWSHNRFLHQIKLWLLNIRTGLVVSWLLMMVIQQLYQMYQLKQIKAQIPLLQQNIQQQQQKKALVERYQHQLKQLQQELEQRVPGWRHQTTPPSTLLEKLEKMIHTFGLTLESLEPDVTASQHEHRFWSCRLILTGTYPSITLFIQRLTQWSTLVTWQQLKLEKIRSEDERDSVSLLRLQGTLRFYVKLVS